MVCQEGEYELFGRCYSFPFHNSPPCQQDEILIDGTCQPLSCPNGTIPFFGNCVPIVQGITEDTDPSLYNESLEEIGFEYSDISVAPLDNYILVPYGDATSSLFNLISFFLDPLHELGVLPSNLKFPGKYMYYDTITSLAYPMKLDPNFYVPSDYIDPGDPPFSGLICPDAECYPATNVVRDVDKVFEPLIDFASVAEVRTITTESNMFLSIDSYGVGSIQLSIPAAFSNQQTVPENRYLTDAGYFTDIPVGTEISPSRFENYQFSLFELRSCSVYVKGCNGDPNCGSVLRVPLVETGVYPPSIIDSFQLSKAYTSTFSWGTRIYYGDLYHPDLTINIDGNVVPMFLFELQLFIRKGDARDSVYVRVVSATFDTFSIIRPNPIQSSSEPPELIARSYNYWVSRFFYENNGQLDNTLSLIYTVHVTYEFLLPLTRWEFPTNGLFTIFLRKRGLLPENLKSGPVERVYYVAVSNAFQTINVVSSGNKISILVDGTVVINDTINYNNAFSTNPDVLPIVTPGEVQILTWFAQTYNISTLELPMPNNSSVSPF